MTAVEGATACPVCQFPTFVVEPTRGGPWTSVPGAARAQVAPTPSCRAPVAPRLPLNCRLAGLSGIWSSWRPWLLVTPIPYTFIRTVLPVQKLPVILRYWFWVLLHLRDPPPRPSSRCFAVSAVSSAGGARGTLSLPRCHHLGRSATWTTRPDEPPSSPMTESPGHAALHPAAPVRCLSLADSHPAVPTPSQMASSSNSVCWEPSPDL